jgi:hypothetical protein
MMVMPHTSAHDFIWVFYTRGHWVRNELCREEGIICFPLGYYFKYMGGEPLIDLWNE